MRVGGDSVLRRWLVWIASVTPSHIRFSGCGPHIAQTRLKREPSSICTFANANQILRKIVLETNGRLDEAPSYRRDIPVSQEENGVSETV